MRLRGITLKGETQRSVTRRGPGVSAALRNGGGALMRTLALTAAVLFATPALSQDRAFSGFQHDSSQPVEVTADSLEVRNSDQMAVFQGAVAVRQGPMRLRAETLEVQYQGGGGQGAIERLRATGDVIMSNGRETARAQAVDYHIPSGQIVLIGDVLIVQDGNSISGERVRIDLNAGTANIEGGVSGVANQTAPAAGDDGRVRVRLEPSGSQ